MFAVLFTLVGCGQYWFLRWQLNQKTASDLKHSAEELRDQIGFQDTWNLQAYNRIPDAPDNYLVMAQNGTLIDVGGDFRRGMNLQVSLPFALEYDQPISFLSDVGENWNLYVHKLRDGIVVLGVLREDAPEDANKRFPANAAQFGASIDEATHTPEREIDASFDFAIIDNNGILHWTTGGIPLRTSSPVIPVAPTLTPALQFDGKTYAEFLQPVVSKSGSNVGLISVFEDITGERLLLLRSAYFNAIVCVLLWVITVAFSTTYLRRVRTSAISCAQIPFLDEDETVEFKSSLRWDYGLQRPNKELERVVVKTIAGFMNSENGGTLIIGMSDSKEILGLQSDYASFKNKQNRDGFELALRQILIDTLGERRCARWIKTRFCSLLGKELCVVTIAPSSEPVFLEGEASGQLFVRVGNSTRPLDAKEALAYARDRWGGFALPRRHPYRPIPNPAG
jgi:hypothetical protein